MRVKSKLLTYRIREVLREGPATAAEIQLELSDLTIRRVRVGLWVLKSYGRVEVCGSIPIERQGQHGGANVHKLYRLAHRAFSETSAGASR